MIITTCMHGQDRVQREYFCDFAEASANVAQLQLSLSPHHSTLTLLACTGQYIVKLNARIAIYRAETSL